MFKSKFPIVEEIMNSDEFLELMEMDKEIDDLDIIIYELFPSIHDFKVMEGSTRVVLVFKELGFVIKIPKNYAGIMQNNTEYERSHEYMMTDVLEYHLYEDNMPILINPYYIEVLDKVINDIMEIQSQIMTKVVTVDKLTDYVDTMEILGNYGEDNAEILAQLLYKLGDRPDMVIPSNSIKIKESMEHYIEFILLGILNEKLDSEFFDSNVSNFGFTEEGLFICIDSGVRDEYDLLDSREYCNFKI